MAECKREEIRVDLIENVNILEKNGFDVKAYNHGVQLNVYDLEGVIQSYYPTTGTIVLHASNERSDHRIFTIRNSDLSNFISLCKNPDDIQKRFQ